ncbi:MAG: transposase [Thermoanaerobaculia bacterium]
MARKLRFIPHARTLIFITCRTVQGRFLLRPGPHLNDLVLGVLGRAQRRYETTISAVFVMSSHVHLLLIVDDAKQPSAFMRYFKSKLAREVNRLTGWRGPLFDRRYEMTVVTDENAAQIERLRYVLGQAVEANLVERVCQWPGVHSAGALIDGTPLEGHWFDRTQEFAARLRREAINPMSYATVETVTFSPIPCWAHLPPELYRARIAALVETIETEGARERKRTGASVLGVKAILSRDPQYRPTSLARSPAPRVHAVTKAARKAFYEIYAAFVSAFREASERLRLGDRNAPFPLGSFPPALPFVAG